ncbi:hypothetical protein JL721_1764 [Aureococcus anophagefferens]|nr:hypothetical protein JL721_1764 [Aureococcus anophagefferens]
MPRRRRSKDRPSLEPSEEPPPDGDAGDAPGGAPAPAEGDGDRELSLDEAFGPEARPAVRPRGPAGARVHRRYREEGLGQASAAAFARVAEGSYRDAAGAFRHLARFGEDDGFAEIWLARVGVEATRGYRGELGELGRELRGLADVMEGGCAHLEAIVAPATRSSGGACPRASPGASRTSALRARGGAAEPRARPRDGRGAAAPGAASCPSTASSALRRRARRRRAPPRGRRRRTRRGPAGAGGRGCRASTAGRRRGGLVWDDARRAAAGDSPALRHKANGTRNGTAARPRALNVDQVFLASEDLTALCPELLDSVAVPRYAVGAALASPPRLTIRSPGSRVAAAVARGGLARWIIVSEGLADVRVLDEGGLGAAERGAGTGATPRGSSRAARFGRFSDERSRARPFAAARDATAAAPRAAAPPDCDALGRGPPSLFDGELAGPDRVMVALRTALEHAPPVPGRRRLLPLRRGAVRKWYQAYVAHDVPWITRLLEAGVPAGPGDLDARPRAATTRAPWAKFALDYDPPDDAGLYAGTRRGVGVNTAILKEEEEKAKIQKDLSILTDRLSKINEALARRVMARNEYDKTIQETEAAYMKILESSQTLLHVLKRETVNLTKKKQYSS